MRLTALVDVRLGAKAAAEVAMMLGVIAFGGEHRADAGHDREGGEEQALEEERVVDVGRGHGAGHRHAIPVGCDMVLGAPLGRSVGFGPVSSPPRLARTEQVSRIRSGWPRSMPTSMAWTRASRPVSAQRARQRRRVGPLAWAAVAVRLRHGVPSRRNRRSVATTRIVSVGGWPGPRPGGRSQASITVAMRCRSLKSNVAILVWSPNLGSHSTGSKIRLNQPKVVMKTASKHRVKAKP